MEAVRARLRLLYHFSDLMYSSWRLLNLSPNNQVRPRPQIFSLVKEKQLWHQARVEPCS